MQHIPVRNGSAPSSLLEQELREAPVPLPRPLLGAAPRAASLSAVRRELWARGGDANAGGEAA